MQKISSEKFETSVRIVLAFAFSFVIFGVVIALCGHNPIDAFYQLFRGGFGSKFNFGSLIEDFIMILTIASAYSLTRRIGYFNLGLEGSFYLGAMFSAAPAFLLPELPKLVIIPLSLVCGFIVAALYGSICGILKAYYNVNEACTTILMNYVAMFFCDYLINNVWVSPGSPIPQTPNVQKNAMFAKLPLSPSRASTAILVAVLVWIFVYFLTYKTTFGFKIRNVATNARYADTVGMRSRRVVLATVMLSCGLGGIAGGLEVLGIYGTFIQNFSQNSAFQGIIACLLVNNNLALVPLASFFISFTRAGGSGMEYYTGISSALIYTVTPLMILFVSMEKMFDYKRFFGFIKKIFVRSKETEGKA